MKEKPKKRPRPQRPQNDGRPLPPRPQANQQANPQAQPMAQPAQGGGLEAEIEDFLRQVTGQAPKTPPPPEPIAAEPTYVEPEILEAEPVSLSDFGRESVAEHVQHHISEGGVESRDAQLASRIETRDDQMDAHLQEVFDHKLGSLRSKKQVEAGATVTRRSTGFGMNAAEILAAFESPDEIRKAIILKEILTPKSLEW